MLTNVINILYPCMTTVVCESKTVPSIHSEWLVPLIIIQEWKGRREKRMGIQT